VLCDWKPFFRKYDSVTYSNYMQNSKVHRLPRMCGVTEISVLQKWSSVATHNSHQKQF
jgi:hypothetical protein